MVGVLSPAAAVTAVPDAMRATAERADGRVVLNVAKSEVVEGDRAAFTVQVPASASARSVTLQMRVTDPVWGTLEWQKVQTRKAAKRVRFVATVSAVNKATYRAVVAYRAPGKPVASKPLSVKVWRWIPLSEYLPYYTTGGSGFGTAALAGRSYQAWGVYTYSAARAWEDRFTPGRNCKAFKGIAGVTDLSADGSSGTVAVHADEVSVWQSPVLTPGMTVPFEVSMTLPYRLSLLATNTSASGVKAYPVIGDPALLCTGV